MPSIKELFVPFLKFGLVGVVNTLITLAAIFVLMEGFRVPDLIANPIGYSLGLINSLLMNKFFTFKSRGKFLPEALRFLIIFAVCYALQYGLLLLLKGVLLVPFLQGAALSYVSQFIGMSFYTVLGFLGNRFFTFRNKEGK